MFTATTYPRHSRVGFVDYTHLLGYHIDAASPRHSRGFLRYGAVISSEPCDKIFPRVSAQYSWVRPYAR